MSVHIDEENMKLETRNVAALPWCWDCKRWAGKREGNFLGYGGEMGETGAYMYAYAVCFVLFLGVNGVRVTK